jgi:transcriptional regulator with XRE-family HTH domain
MQTCMAADRYCRLFGHVTHSPWIDTVNRLLKAKPRPDPKDRTRLIRWGQGTLAEACGLRANTLSDMMNGKREPSLDTLRRLAEALEVPLFFMLMSEQEQNIYQGAHTAHVQNSAEEIAKREARDYYISKIDGLFEQWGQQRSAPAVTETESKPALPERAIRHKKRA